MENERILFKNCLEEYEKVKLNEKIYESILEKKGIDKKAYLTSAKTRYEVDMIAQKLAKVQNLLGEADNEIGSNLDNLDSYAESRLKKSMENYFAFFEIVRFKFGYDVLGTMEHPVYFAELLEKYNITKEAYCLEKNTRSAADALFAEVILYSYMSGEHLKDIVCLDIDTLLDKLETGVLCNNTSEINDKYEHEVFDIYVKFVLKRDPGIYRLIEKYDVRKNVFDLKKYLIDKKYRDRIEESIKLILNAAKTLKVSPYEMIEIKKGKLMIKKPDEIIIPDREEKTKPAVTKPAVTTPAATTPATNFRYVGLYADDDNDSEIDEDELELEVLSEIGLYLYELEDKLEEEDLTLDEFKEMNRYERDSILQRIKRKMEAEDDAEDCDDEDYNFPYDHVIARDLVEGHSVFEANEDAYLYGGHMFDDDDDDDYDESDW